MTKEEIKNNEIDKKFRETAIAIREFRGMKQCELARLTGITYNRICQWELGKKQLRLYEAYVIAKALGINIDGLLGLDSTIKLKKVTVLMVEES